MNEKNISFLITNYNTKDYTEWCYNSIRKNLGYVHEIVLIEDGSEDGTWELLQNIQNKDTNVIIHRNDGNVGIAYSYNKAVELASNEIVCMLHSDMYVPTKFDKIMLKYMKEYTFLTSIRVEPPLYDESVDKVIENFGETKNGFKEYEFLKWVENNEIVNKDRVEQRMFFPWMITKNLYEMLGGIDTLFLKYMVDDDDFYLRVKMSGAKYTQVWETAVYHIPSRSTKYRGDKLSFDEGKWDTQYNKSIRNFIRKWGCWPGSVWDEQRDMKIPKKYDIGFVIENCNMDVLKNLEPWASCMYIKKDKYTLDYIFEEQKNTDYNLVYRIKDYNSEDKFKHDVIISFDTIPLNPERVGFLHRLPEILSDSGEVGEMEYDIFKLKINNLNTIEGGNVCIK